MKKINLLNSRKVALWEFNKGIRTPMFLILTFLIPLLIVGIGGLEFFTQELMQTQPVPLAFMDKTGEYSDRINQQFAETNISLELFPGDKAELEQKVWDGDYAGFFIVSRENIEEGFIQVFTEDPRNIPAHRIREPLEKVITDIRLEGWGLTREEIDIATRPLTLQVQPLDEEAAPGTVAEFVAPLALAMILLLSVIFSGQMLMYGVIKEKRNRVVEILLSSISSFELLIGKIMGYGLLSLLQVGIWATAAIFTASRFIDFQELGLNAGIILPPLLIFLLGYFMLSSIFAALGSTMKEAEEGSQAQGLIILIPMIPLFLSGILITNPDALWVQVLTHIPPFIPAMALLRMAATDIPWWEMGTITLALILSTIFFIYIGGRIFSRGILQYDAVGFKDLKKILRKKD